MTGSRLANLRNRACIECTYYREEWDGDYGGIYCGSFCDKEGNERFGNLITFPFKNKRHCFVIDFWFSEFVEEFKNEDQLPHALEKWREKYFPNGD